MYPGRGEAGDELLLRQEPCLWEAVEGLEGLVDLEVDAPLVDVLLQLVLVHDFLRDLCNADAHVFFADEVVHDVEVADIQGEPLGAVRGHGLEEHFDGCHFSGLGGGVARVMHETTVGSAADTVRLVAVQGLLFSDGLDEAGDVGDAVGRYGGVHDGVEHAAAALIGGPELLVELSHVRCMP